MENLGQRNYLGGHGGRDPHTPAERRRGCSFEPIPGSTIQPDSVEIVQHGYLPEAYAGHKGWLSGICSGECSTLLGGQVIRAVHAVSDGPYREVQP